MRKKEILSVLFFCLFIIQATYNQTFERLYQTTFDEIVYDALLVNSDTCVFALNSGNFLNDTYTTKFFNLELKNGQIKDSLIIAPELQGHYFRGIFDLLKTNDTLFIGVGKMSKFESNEELQYLVHFDNKFKILFDTIIDLPAIEERFQKSILTKDDCIVSVGTVVNSVNYERLLCVKSINGSLISYETYSHPTSLTSTAVIDVPHKSKYHMYIYGGIDRAINVIDKSTLQIDTSYSYPVFFGPIDAILDDVDSSFYYVAGKQGIANGTMNDLSFLKMNDDCDILDQFTYDLDSNTLYTYKCFSPFYDHIYFGGVYPFTQDPPTLYPEPRWILLYKLAKNGEIIWQKFYKGEVNYMAIKILATADEGALIFSTKYDWYDPVPMQRDVHILKIDSLGNYTPITSTPEVMDQMQKQILVYPNPATERVNFVFGLYHDLEIGIYDLSGEMIFSGRFKHQAEVDISRLKPGTYIYRISGEKGFYEEGKIVKH